MCIIVYKPANIDFPELETLLDCWTSNPDGAGLMVATGDAVVIRKGFMTWRAFADGLEATRLEYGDAAAYALHFRIATHGEVSPECCHPFSLTNDLEVMRQPNQRAAVGVAHNGVILGRKTDKRTSDTMDYVAHLVYPLSRAVGPDFIRSKDAADVLTDTCEGSRLCILAADGTARLVGSWHVEDGVFYSNTHYKIASWRRPSSRPTCAGDVGAPYGSSLWASWDDDDAAAADPWAVIEPSSDVIRACVKTQVLPSDICEACEYVGSCIEYGAFCETEIEALIEVENQLIELEAE